MEKRNALTGQLHYRNTNVYSQNTSSPKDNTHTFTFVSDDNGGMRRDWFSGDSYEEVLSIKGGSFENLRTFFKDHDRSTDSAVGRIENVAVDGSTIKGDVVFGTGTDEQNIYRKYDEGILTDVSIGYAINDYVVTEREGEPDLVTITDYDIFEVSAVGIGFDQGAKKRDMTMEKESEVLERVKALEEFYGV